MVAHLKHSSLVFLLLNLLTINSPAQNGSEKGIFTLSVTPPASAKNVQVRYFFTGESGAGQGASTTQVVGSTLLIAPSVETESAKGLRLIAYAPGCQFVTLTVEDLSSNRKSEFWCQSLPTLDFYGKVDVGDLASQGLEVEALYVGGWIMPFFGIGSGGVSPLNLTKAIVASDGTFVMDLPNFADDASWPLSKDAGLIFVLWDAKTGKRLSTLTPLYDLAQGNMVPVAPSYPKIAFATPK